MHGAQSSWGLWLRQQGGLWTGENILSSSLPSLYKTGNSSTLRRQPAFLDIAAQLEKQDLCIFNSRPLSPLWGPFAKAKVAWLPSVKDHDAGGRARGQGALEPILWLLTVG